MPVPARDLRLFIGQDAQKRRRRVRTSAVSSQDITRPPRPASSCNLTVLTRGHG
jgi:hypothetical protein